ncbi:Oidioi.mRNA.OKI2018_I69.chr1.g1345.t1.cds [Oikopleura dioica]|uniref:Oidioi.mRNA.OKI2018_I69.chr1.g1345.t1.cds n=1 Tax=Oikopleura dioica TaxID=34765 RepID=A0ABN7SR61_OIKDI|nr:Oidioi.mRNA.OKI2018_I69.chr1.g1345.t1.cds [Oikopleura dioica]
MSYKRFIEEPYRLPALSCDKEYHKRVKLNPSVSRSKTAKILRWVRNGCYHSKKDNDQKASFGQDEIDASAFSKSTAAKSRIIQGFIASENSSFDDDEEYRRAAWENLEEEAQAHDAAKESHVALNRGAAAFLDTCADDESSASPRQDTAAPYDRPYGTADAISVNLARDGEILLDDGDNNSTINLTGQSRRRRLALDSDSDTTQVPQREPNTFATDVSSDGGGDDDKISVDLVSPCSLISDDSDYSQTYAPILNVISSTPNIFDSETRFKILPDSCVKTMPRCKNSKCLFTTEKKAKMDRHIATCRQDTEYIFRQSVQGDDVNAFIEQLVEEGYLPSVDYTQKFFATYDIESLMSEGPFSKKEKFHNLVTLASFTSDKQKEIFYCKDFRYESTILMIAQYIKHLEELRDEMIEELPDCITQGIHFYSARVNDKELREHTSPEDLQMMRKKLNYLKDFQKLKIYGWFSETYDMPVLYPLLIAVLYEFAGRDAKQINIIKRGAGYMLIEALGLSFRDFKNYTAPMKLDKLARSCGLDPDHYCKGDFPYEWYTTTEQLMSSKKFAAYSAFHSTLSSIKKGREKFPVEMNSIIHEKVSMKLWDELDIQPIINFLNLKNLKSDPVVKDAIKNKECNFTSAQEFYDLKVAQLKSLLKFDKEKNCFQCDPLDEKALDFFNFSPKKYADSVDLWSVMERQFRRKPSMMEFLFEYNFNDVKLLEGAISCYAKKYSEKFGIGLHCDLSIATTAQKLAFVMYDKECPPIYSIPPSHAFFYRKCREKLSGGICQVLHRAVFLNRGDDDNIPKGARLAPNGKPFKKCELLDYNSLYPAIFRGPMPCGPGIFYHPQQMQYSNARVKTINGEPETRFFSEGLFAQRENTSLESIKWLEYLNWKEGGYNGKIQHSYNRKEIKIGGYSVDGYVELDEYISPFSRVKKKIIFEFRGCSYHACPWCKRKPYFGQKVKVSGGAKYKKITVDELRARDDARLHTIVEALRRGDDIERGAPNPVLVTNEDNSDDGDEEGFTPVEGPTNFHHEIKIKYACRWLKQWSSLEMMNKPPFSKSYPFLYRGSSSKFNGLQEGTEGVTEAMFKELVNEDDEETGQSKFFGFALVDLRSTDKIKQDHPFIPPIFDKVHLNPEDVQGHLKNVLSERELNRLFPKEENAFCYNTTEYLATSEMLRHYHKLGMEYKVHWFVTYFRGEPFKKFVNKMVADRVASEKNGDVAGQTVAKLLMNGCIAQAAGDEPHAKIIKKSAKGCNDGVPLSFYEYLIAIFGSDYNQRIKKSIPQIQLDRKRERMKTWVMHKKVINPILSKRIICDDKVSTLPLRRYDGELI